MAAEDSWVFDSLVCFLHGPIWNAPLQTFIEEKSLVFDPNLQPDIHNSDIIRIHEEYKHLVDYMLGSFMEEMQITPEQFENACIESGSGRNLGGDGHSFHFHQGLFQQIWAASDIKIFVRMMTQRNVELQLQALDLIEKNQLALLQETSGGGGGDSLAYDNGASDGKVTDSESGGGNSISDKYAEMEEFIAKSMHQELSTPEAALTPDQQSSDDVTSSVADKFARLNLFFEQKTPQVDPDDVSSRQEYLRQQRDKILEIKKRTRAKQLQETVSRRTGDNSTSMRPSSALAAQKLLENGGNGSIQEQNDRLANSDDASMAAMQLRKTLAKRLRAEVVENQ